MLQMYSLYKIQMTNLHALQNLRYEFTTFTQFKSQSYKLHEISQISHTTNLQSLPNLHYKFPTFTKFTL